MSGKSRFVLALALAWGFVLLALAGTALLVGADLGAAEREQAMAILRDRAAHVVVAGLQEALARGEAGHPVAFAFEQPGHRVAHGFVVIDDMDHGFGAHRGG